MPAWRSGRRCCTSPEWSSARSSPRTSTRRAGASAQRRRGDARGDRRAGRDEPRVRRRRASRRDRDLSHVCRRSRLGDAHCRCDPQRPDRRGGRAEGRGRHAHPHDAGQRSLSCASAFSTSRISPTGCSSISPDGRRAPPGPNCRPNSSSSHARWGRPSCWITRAAASLGLVLEEGSPTAHVAIVARAFDIPVVGRVDDATSRIEAGDIVVVDGDHANVLIRPSADIQQSVAAAVEARTRRRAYYETLRAVPPVTRDGIAIRLMLNAGLLIDLDAARRDRRGGCRAVSHRISADGAGHLPGCRRPDRILPARV